jgi:ASC-1-like (ASCH) protein
MNHTYVLILLLVVLLALAVAFYLVGRNKSKTVSGAGEDDGDYEGGFLGGIFGGGTFRFKISDPEYTAMLKGDKTVDARLDKAPFNTLKVGESVVVVRSRPKEDTSEYPGGQYKFITKITKITKYPDIDALLKKEGVAKVYPGRTSSAAVEQFKKYLAPDTPSSSPVLAFEFAPPGKSTHRGRSTQSRSRSYYGHGDDDDDPSVDNYGNRDTEPSLLDYVSASRDDDMPRYV